MFLFFFAYANLEGSSNFFVCLQGPNNKTIFKERSNKLFRSLLLVFLHIQNWCPFGHKLACTVKKNQLKMKSRCFWKLARLRVHILPFIVKRFNNILILGYSLSTVHLKVLLAGESGAFDDSIQPVSMQCSNVNHSAVIIYHRICFINREILREKEGVGKL